jgi:hypothetical protein
MITLVVMGLSRGVTVHVGTSFGTAQETSSATSGSVRRASSSSKTIKLRLNRSRRQLAQEKEQQKRQIASKESLSTFYYILNCAQC